jgi:TRAP transporter TAXI family solute receptor
LAAKGWDEDRFKKVRRMSDPKQVRALCADEVEAITLMYSSLNDLLADVDEACKLRAVSIEGPDVDKLITEKPSYRYGKIPKEGYFDAQESVLSFGLGATFVASASTSPKVIYNVVKEVVENFRDFQSLHPSLRDIEKSELPYAGISAPLHPGAIRYYKEARLLKKR